MLHCYFSSTSSAVFVRLSRETGRRRGLEKTGEGDFVAVVVVLQQQHDVLLVAVVGSEYIV